MLWSPLGQSTRIVPGGGPHSGVAAGRVTRIPPGHPEGYLESFANVYSEVALAIKAARSGQKPPDGVHFPTIEDGVKGLAFVEAGGEVVEGERGLGEAASLLVNSAFSTGARTLGSPFPSRARSSPNTRSKRSA